MSSTTNQRLPSISYALPGAVFCVLGGIVAQATSWQSLLSTEGTAMALMSSGLWRSLIAALGGRVAQDNAGGWIAEVGFLPLLLAWSAFAGLSGLVSANLIRWTTRASWNDSLTTTGFAFGWWWLMGAWELTRLLAFSMGLETVEQFLLVSPQLWQALALAGWLAQILASGAASAPRSDTDDTRGLTPPRSPEQLPWKGLFAMIAVYIVVFTAMNWRLWSNLRIPHGDSAMYEEHLWNLTHGKGFRSYLDQGLFFGEHIQVVHLLLLPLHLIWPSHLLLELCESTALALGAIPVFRLAQRSTGSARAGLLMAAAYLLYFPLHFLDIEIDLKTFRPESFCVPFFLFAFDALERGRLRQMCVLLLFALSAKEDYSIIIAPLGVWIALQAYFGKLPASDSSSVADPKTRRTQIILGLGLAAFGVVYLVLATRVVIPWFRSGAELHYVKYFSKFGNSMNEVVWNMLTKPRLLFGELATARSLMYALSMLLPVGFIALLSPCRLAVALPLFGILCLNELAQDPRHHFHAPLVPVVFWATAIGLGNTDRVWSRLSALLHSAPPHLLPFTRHFVWTSAFASGLFLSMSPIAIPFWDAHASTSLWRLYARDPRADHFSAVFAQIPPTARVASTDFVHPRFTHHERSYDYSHYRRRIAGYEDKVPDDTDFIVIDTRHPYSDLKSLDQVRELKEFPDDWELLPDKTQGHFILLRRKKHEVQEN